MTGGDACCSSLGIEHGLNLIVSAAADDLRGVLADCIQTLLANYRELFRPALEPAVQFAAAVLCNQQHGTELSSTRRQLACLAMRLLRVLSSHTRTHEYRCGLSW